MSKSKLRVLLSLSQEHVEIERLAMIEACRSVADELHAQFSGVEIEPIWWEDPEAGVAQAANIDPQRTILDHRAEPGDCHLVVAVFGERFGTEPGRKYLREDGTKYQSGTEYEVDQGLMAYEDKGYPRVLIYRRTELDPLGTDDAQYVERTRQRGRVEKFFARIRQPDGDARGIETYKRPECFVNRIRKDLLGELTKLVKLQLAARRSFPAEAFHRQPSPLGSLWTTGLTCLGRGPERSELDRIWSVTGERIATIWGPRGMGKSVLARAWVEEGIRTQRIPACRVFGYAFNNPNEDSSPDEMFRRLAKALDVEFPRDSTPERRAELLVDRMGDNEWVLLLDGVESLFVEAESQVGVEPELEEAEDLIKYPGVRRFLNLFGQRPAGLCLLTSTQVPKDVGRHPDIPVCRLPDLLGARLLSSLKVHGPPAAMLQASRDWGGHPLGLTHLALELRRYSGKVEARGELEALLDLQKGSSDLTRFQSLLRHRDAGFSKELRQLMRAIALFDEPAGVEEIGRLYRPGIPGFTDALDGCSGPKEAELFQELIDNRLIALVSDREDPINPGVALGDRVQDDHPLIREYFYRTGREESLGAWRVGQLRLSDMYLQQAERPAEHEADLPALEAATRHRILSGDPLGAMEEIYLPDIRKSGSTIEGGPAPLENADVAYNTRELGAFDGDLRILRLLFAEPWSQVLQEVQFARNGLWEPRLYYEVGFDLRATGRLIHANQCFKTSIKLWAEKGHLKNAAMASGDRSLTLLLSGETRGAVKQSRRVAEEGVELADRFGDLRERVRQRSNLLHALVVANDSRASSSTLETMRVLVAESEGRASLNSLWVYEALLSLGRIEELIELLRQRETLAATRESDERDETSPTQTLHLDEAIHEWAYGQVALRQALEREKLPAVGGRPFNPELARTAERHFDSAIQAVEKAHTVHHKPRFWHARAEARLLTGNLEGARADLREVRVLAEYYGMRFFRLTAAVSEHRCESTRWGQAPSPQTLSELQTQLRSHGFESLRSQLQELVTSRPGSTS